MLSGSSLWLIVHSMVLHMHLVKTTGQYIIGFGGFLPGLGIGMAVAFLQLEGKL